MRPYLSQKVFNRFRQFKHTLLAANCTMQHEHLTQAINGHSFFKSGKTYLCSPTITLVVSELNPTRFFKGMFLALRESFKKQKKSSAVVELTSTMSKKFVFYRVSKIVIIYYRQGTLFSADFVCGFIHDEGKKTSRFPQLLAYQLQKSTAKGIL